MKSDCSKRNIKKIECNREKGGRGVCERETDRNGGDKVGKWRDHYLVYLLVTETIFLLHIFQVDTGISNFSDTSPLYCMTVFFVLFFSSSLQVAQ